jgi:hypothetical protein
MDNVNAKPRPRSEPLSLRQFALRVGLPEKTVLRYIHAGRIFGARKHPLTKKWWIYPPAKLLPRL